MSTGNSKSPKISELTKIIKQQEAEIANRSKAQLLNALNQLIRTQLFGYLSSIATQSTQS